MGRKHRDSRSQRNAYRAAASVLALMIAAPDAGMADEVPASGAKENQGLEEIVVIARQRKESFQEVPVAVSVFTDAMIEKAGIERASDFIALTPNVSLTETDSAGVAFITIRGLSQVRNGESPVAIVVDGVIQPEAREFNQELFDIQQIEVLKGPQGALYGRNAIGGAIVIQTKEPTNETEIKFDGGAGNAGLVRAHASVSGALIEDKLLVRVSAGHKSHNGYNENVFLRTPADFFQEQSGRVRMIYKATDHFSADFRASYSDNKSGALEFVRNNRDVNGVYNYGLTSPNTANPNDVGPPISSNILGRGHRQIFSTSLKLDWELDFGTLTSVSAYDWIKESTAADNSPYTSAALTTQASVRDIKGISQEIRFTSPGTDRFRYIIGAYYLHTDRFVNRNTGRDIGQGIVLFGINGPTSDNPTLTAFQDDNNQNAYAGFGQFNFDITEALEISAALRYDRDEREQIDMAPPAFSVTSGKVRNASFDSWQPKLTLRYKFNDQSSIYANYAKGFRSGGFNQNGVRARALLTDPNSLVQDEYKDETSASFEGGFKTRFWDNRVSLNGAVFYTKFDNEQFFSFIPSAGAQIVTNIDKVDLKGFEADLLVKVTDNLELFGTVGYTDSEIKEYGAAPLTVGKKAPYVPKYGLTAGFQYTQPINDALEGTLRVDWQRMGPQFWDPQNNGQRDAVDLTNIRMGVANPSGKWQITAWMKNVFDKAYNAEFVAGGFAYRADPRTYGIDFGYRF